MPGEFDESKHPRADDGKFGQGAGSASPLAARRAAAGKIAAKGNGKKVGRTKVAGKIAAKGQKALSKKQEIDKAFVHVVRGEHAKAKAIFDKHGMSAPDNVRDMGKRDGFDYAAGSARSPRPVATVPGSGKERLDSARAARPRSDLDLVDAIGNGAIKDAGGRTIALTPEAQAAVRSHLVLVAESHGLTARPLHEGNVLASRSQNDLGGAYGMYHPSTGKIELSDAMMAHLAFHAEDHAYDRAGAKESLEIEKYQNRGLLAYAVVVHETVHGTGPTITIPAGKTAKYQLAEELSTEMTARYITATAHGLAPHLMQGATWGYDDVMHQAVTHVAEIAGVGHDAAFAAVAKSSLAMKQRSGAFDPDDVIATIGEGALRNLQASRPDTNAALRGKWQDLAAEMNKRYPWPR